VNHQVCAVVGKRLSLRAGFLAENGRAKNDVTIDT
jgi:hypothetical protein